MDGAVCVVRGNGTGAKPLGSHAAGCAARCGDQPPGRRRLRRHSFGWHGAGTVGIPRDRESRETAVNDKHMGVVKHQEYHGNACKYPLPVGNMEVKFVPDKANARKPEHRRASGSQKSPKAIAPRALGSAHKRKPRRKVEHYSRCVHHKTDLLPSRRKGKRHEKRQ